jgi:hypothetical protein
MKTKRQTIIDTFMKNPAADVKKVAAKYNTSPNAVYAMRKAAAQQSVFLAQADAVVEAMNLFDTQVEEAKDVQVPKALDVQVGGSHYKNLKIQPVEYIHANQLPYIEGNIVKYITRWRDKNGVKDLEKIKHYIDLLIELEKLQ